MAGIGHAAVSAHRGADFIGGGASVALKRALAARGHPASTSCLEAMMVSFYKGLRRGFETPGTGNGLYPGVHGNARASFGAVVCRLGLCTNKAGHPLRQSHFRALGIAPFFSPRVIGSERRPPAASRRPDMLLAALAALGARPRKRLLVVGDSRCGCRAPPVRPVARSSRSAMATHMVRLLIFAPTGSLNRWATCCFISTESRGGGFRVPPIEASRPFRHRHLAPHQSCRTIAVFPAEIGC